MDVQIVSAGSTIAVATPHPNTNFSRKAKALSGYRSPDRATWIFDICNEGLVRTGPKRACSINGTGDADVVSVQMTIEKSEWRGPVTVTVAGRVICRAFDRDSGVKLGPGVVKISGTAPSGGAGSPGRLLPTGFSSSMTSRGRPPRSLTLMATSTSRRPASSIPPPPSRPTTSKQVRHFPL